MTNTKNKSIRTRRRAGDLGHWLRALWPVVMTVAGGWIYFQEPIIESIRSTPHPALVYMIFAIAATVVVLIMLALWHYMRDLDLVFKLRAMPEEQRYEAVFPLSKRRYDLRALFVALFAPVRREHHEHVVQHEVHVADEAMRGRLALANYLTGALVGMGLVGTFVGLLDTLADMGALFSSMTQMGDKNADPSALLGELLTRLQEPMRGMGTAFVASLYGLMSSLVLGLVLHSAKRSCAHVLTVALNLVREVSETQDDTEHKGEWSEVIHAWTDMLHAIRAQQAEALKAFADFRADIVGLGQRLGSLENYFADKQKREEALAHDTHQSLQSMVHVASAMLAQQTAMVKLLSDQRESMLAQTVQSIRSVAEPVTSNAAWNVASNGVSNASTKAATPSAKRWLWVVALVALGVALGLWRHDKTQTASQANTQAHSQAQIQEQTQTNETARNAAARNALPKPASETKPIPETTQTTPSPSVQATTVRTERITLKEGESLERIATRHRISLKELLALNPSIHNPNLVRINQSIEVPLVNDDAKKRAN